LYFIILIFPRPEEIEEIYRHFDKDPSGYISELEIYNIIKKYDPKVTRDDIRRMICSVDVDKDGQISLKGTY
jgi:Ca2+-binding EF-hand superfamily protein